jgi:hypothetical protein
MGLSDATIGTYRPQYRSLSAFRYLDVNPLSTRYALFITLVVILTHQCEGPSVSIPWGEPTSASHKVAS